jgi:predicted nucleotidyltransferase component of viral defense system
MIGERYIKEWAATHPWRRAEQVEQDLLLSRVLVAIYSDTFLSGRLAFRGGTALHKLYFSPQVRYSEDIDLVQVAAGPFGEVFDHLKDALSFLPNMRREQKSFNNLMRFRLESEIPPTVPIKIKIETNCREHFCELGYRYMPFAMENGWFSGACEIRTFQLEELLGTKMRALYQRKKGRDLFDLYYALTTGDVDCEAVMRCFRKYIGFSTGDVPSRKMFCENIENKLTMPEFLSDTDAYLRAGVNFDPHKAWIVVKERFLP